MYQTYRRIWLVGPAPAGPSVNRKIAHHVDARPGGAGPAAAGPSGAQDVGNHVYAINGRRLRRV